MPTSPPESINRPLTGIVCCVGALLAFATQDTLVKRLSESYPVLEVVTLRTAMVLVILFIAGGLVRGRSVLKTANLKPLLLRGFVAFMAFSTYYVALTTIPLADAAAVYMTAPLFVTALSALVLRERVGWHRWGAIVAGFGAVVFMLNPGNGLLQVAAVLPMFSALCYAVIPILTRRFGLAEHPITMSLYSIMGYLVMCVFAATAVHLGPGSQGETGLWATVLEHWRPIAAPHLLLALLAGGLFTMGLLGITQAYRVAAASVVAPFEYSYLVWATLLGLLVFGDVPGLRTLVGGAGVVACGCYIIYRERLRQRG